MNVDTPPKNSRKVPIQDNNHPFFTMSFLSLLFPFFNTFFGSNFIGRKDRFLIAMPFFGPD